MKNSQLLKLDMEAGIDGILVNEKKRSSSILKKFLLFNFFVFLVLGLFTVLYLKAIQPNLIKKDHPIILS